MKLLASSAPTFFVLVALTGCATGIQLTDGGRGVQNVSRADMPTSCNLLGDVAIGIPPDAARPRTEEELIILMRNKAGEVGGNHLVLDNSQQREDSSGNPYFRGRGIAYACPESADSTDGDTAGGDDGDDDTGGMDDSGVDDSGSDDSGSDDSSSADDDALMEDLLGE